MPNQNERKRVGPRRPFNATGNKNQPKSANVKKTLTSKRGKAAVSRGNRRRSDYARNKPASVAQYQHELCGDSCTMMANNATIGFDIIDFEYFCEAYISYHYRMRPTDINTTTPPSEFKAYFFWALYSRLRDFGFLRGSFAMSFPSFPTHYKIPNSIALYLAHVAPWVGKKAYEGVKLGFNFVTNADPIATTGAIKAGGAGVGSSASGVTIHTVTSSAVYREYVTVENTINYGILSAAANGFNYNEYINALGGCVEYGKLPKYAPDASAYCMVDTVNSLCCPVPHFDPEVAYALCCHNIQTNVTWNFTKPIPSFQYYSLETVELGRSFGAAVAISWTLNKIRFNPALHIKFQKKYEGVWLDSLYPIQRHVDFQMFHELVLAGLTQFNRMGGTVTNVDLWHYMCVCDHALWAKLQPYNFVYGPNGGTIHKYLTSQLFLTAKLAAPIAHYISEIGPVVYSGRIYLPMPKMGSGATFTQNNTWHMHASTGVYSTAANAGRQGDIFGSNTLIGGVPVNPVLGTIVINAAWVTGYTALDELYVWNYLAQWVVENYHNQLSTGTGGEIFDTYILPPIKKLGSAALLAYAVVVDSGDTLDYLSTSYDRAGQKGVSYVGSPLQLLGTDLAEAIAYGYCVELQGIVNDYPFIFSSPNPVAGTQLGPQLTRETSSVNGQFVRQLSTAKSAAAGKGVGTLEWLSSSMKPVLSAIMSEMELGNLVRTYAPRAARIVTGHVLRTLRSSSTTRAVEWHRPPIVELID